MFKSIFNFFNNAEPLNWENNNPKKNSAYDPLQAIKAQIATDVRQGMICRKVFVDTKILSQMNVSPNDFYWEKPETDLSQMYQAIQAATEMGYYFTVVSPLPWKRVLLIDIRQIPIRYIQNEWSNNRDWFN